MKESNKPEIGATVEQLNSWYKEARAYQKSIGIDTSMPECVDFYEGRQWPEVTEATRHFPRPVVNIIEMNCNNKKSQVLSSPVKIVYKSALGTKNETIDKFNRFAEYEFARLRQDDLDHKAILDGIIKGSYCLYYYYDNSIVGLDGLVEGDIAAQLVDPINVLFANPNEKDEQKQDWVMLISRENIESIKKMADKDVDQSKIQDDNNDSVYNEQESDTEKYATVMTRFFRHNGEVYFEKATQEVVFNKARPLTPNVEHFKAAVAGKKEEKAKEIKPEDKFKRSKKATLYPIVFSSWKERDKSIYGRGEVETIIPNQKAINWTLGLQILIAQNEGAGGAIVSPDALRGQKITNKPGQTLTDYSKSGDGIRFPKRPGMTQASVSLAEKIADLTRVVTGSSEVMSGEVISAGMSGAAIAQLQAQALKPIEDLQKAYWRSKEKVGEIMEQFLRLYFKDKKFQYTADKEGKEIKEDIFNSADYKDIQFDVVAEAVAGTIMSDVADINILDGLFAKGAINLKTYINCYPDNAIANRQKLIESVEAEEQNVVNQLTKQVQEQQARLQQQEGIIQSAESIVNENRALKEKLIALQAEYTGKVQQMNKVLTGMAVRGKEFYNDAQAMAGELAKQRGLIKEQPAQESGTPGTPLV